MNEKGKCFSMTNRGQRNEKDYYQTPYGLTYELYDKYSHIITSDKTILEPCLGAGAIKKALLQKDNKLNIVGEDIITGQDFYEQKNKYDLIITNPPYKNTHLFIEKCYSISKEFFLLLPIAHLSGQQRLKDSTYRGLVDVSIFSRMPMFSKELKEDGSFTTGMMVAGWFYFSNNKKSEDKPTISFIDVSKWVLSKKICPSIGE